MIIEISGINVTINKDEQVVLFYMRFITSAVEWYKKQFSGKEIEMKFLNYMDGEPYINIVGSNIYEFRYTEFEEYDEKSYEIKKKGKNGRVICRK